MNKNVCGSIDLDTLTGISQIVCLGETVSTQAVARELALDGASEKTLVLAETQTGGRGRQGSEWESPLGGLYLTLLLRPETGVRFLPDLSVLAGEVVAEALTTLYGVKARVKKPNDVYAWHPRRRKWLKICGILTEAASQAGSPDWLLLGLGVNLNASLKLQTAVCLKDILKKEVSRTEFLEGFFRLFWERYSAWEYASRAKSS